MKNLLIFQIQRLLDAEHIRLIEYPKLVAKISNEAFRQIVWTHSSKIELQIQRLEKTLYLMHESVQRRSCAVMDALLDEALELTDSGFTSEEVDAGLLSCVRKITLYEVTAYDSACSYAFSVNQEKISGLLIENLEQERMMEQALSRLAEAISKIKVAFPHDEISIW